MKNPTSDDGFTYLCSLSLKAPHPELRLRPDPIVSSPRRRAAADHIDGGLDESSSLVMLARLTKSSSPHLGQRGAELRDERSSLDGVAVGKDGTDQTAFHCIERTYRGERACPVRRRHREGPLVIG